MSRDREHGREQEGHPLARRTAPLQATSRWLYRIDHHSSRPSASVVVVGVLLRALPGARERFMMLEEAPDELLEGVVEDQRRHHDDAVAQEGVTRSPGSGRTPR